ncbi:MAG: M48 family metallopeptidase [Thermodesulfobacteriota bacterium]
MEYRPSLPEHNDNVSHEQPVREFILLFSGLTIFLLIAFWTLGLFVDIAVNYISPDMEALIFSPFDASASELADEGEMQQTELQQMVDELRKCIHISYPLKVYLVETDNANAMALPGGRIVVFSGLLDKVQSENGLFFVLAHELAHFKNRDHLRGIGRGIVFTALAAFMTGAGSDLTQLFTPTVNFSEAKYSQKRESMADQQALQALACYYGHVGGATEFFEAMKPDENDSVIMIGHYFESHPEAVERIEDLHRLTRELGLDAENVLDLPAVLIEK